MRRILILIGIAVTACGSDAVGPEGALPACTGAVSVSVSGGAAPTISWTPACRLFFVLVEPLESGADQWGIISDSTNAIAPPVTYGVTPAGAVQQAAPVPLLVGQSYKVVLFRWTGPGSQDGVAIGTATFTR